MFKKPKSGDAVDEDGPKADDDSNNDPAVEGNEGEDPKIDDDNGSGADSDDLGAGGSKCIKPSIIPKYLPFQQAAIREKVKSLSPEEDSAIKEYIEAEYAAALEVWECPWLATAKVGDNVDDLQRKYYQKLVLQHSVAFCPSHILRNATRLAHTLRVTTEEVTRQTGYRTFFLWGGPSVQTPGTVHIGAYVCAFLFVLF